MAALKRHWSDASAGKRALMLGLPVALLALILGGVLLATLGGGDGQAEAEVVAPTSTPAPTPTSGPPTPSTGDVMRYFAAVYATATAETAPPASSGGVANNNTAPPASGGGQPYRPPAQTGTGPGPATGTDMRLSIPAIGVNASVYARTVGTNGQMGNPAGAWDVIWYDFSQNFPGVGGRPGEAGANAVFAGHVDYIRVGPAVFWSLRDLQPGDQVVVYTAAGPISYAVQSSWWAQPYEDFTGYVAQHGAEEITLITCIGGFSGGHYSNRFIVRGIRI